MLLRNNHTPNPKSTASGPDDPDRITTAAEVAAARKFEPPSPQPVGPPTPCAAGRRTVTTGHARGDQRERPEASQSGPRAGYARDQSRDDAARYPRSTPLETFAAPDEAARAVFALPTLLPRSAKREEPRCPRCDRRHPGLCATVGTGRHGAAMRALGIEPARAEREAMSDERARALLWTHGWVTKTGRDISLAIACCGRVIPCRVDGTHAIGSQRCRSRWCPRCARYRSAELARDLATVIAMRGAAASLRLVTLTQPKPVDYDPQIAIDRARGFWHRIANKKTKLGRWFHSRFAGAVRVLETTWSQSGGRRKHGGVVGLDGWHAHWHLLLEGGTDADVRELIKRWCAMTGGSPLAQDAQRFREPHVAYVCKYLFKGIEDCPVNLAQRLARTLHGKRMIDAVGSWRGWRHEVPVERKPIVQWATTEHPLPDGGIVRRSLDVARLVDLYADDAARRDETVAYVARVGREEHVHYTTIEGAVSVLPTAPWASDLSRARRQDSS